jgi:hypothetical protein
MSVELLAVCQQASGFYTMDGLRRAPVPSDLWPPVGEGENLGSKGMCTGGIPCGTSCCSHSPQFDGPQDWSVDSLNTVELDCLAAESWPMFLPNCRGIAVSVMNSLLAL